MELILSGAAENSGSKGCASASLAGIGELVEQAAQLTRWPGHTGESSSWRDHSPPAVHGVAQSLPAPPDRTVNQQESPRQARFSVRTVTRFSSVIQCFPLHHKTLHSNTIQTDLIALSSNRHGYSGRGERAGELPHVAAGREGLAEVSARANSSLGSPGGRVVLRLDAFECVIDHASTSPGEQQVTALLTECSFGGFVGNPRRRPQRKASSGKPLPVCTVPEDTVIQRPFRDVYVPSEQIPTFVRLRRS